MIESGWVLRGSIHSREWSKWWCFAHLYGKYEISGDVGDGPRESALPSEAVREFFDWDAEEKAGHGREATTTNSNATYPLVKVHTNCRIAVSWCGEVESVVDCN